MCHLGLGEFYFIFPSFYLILTDVFLYIEVVSMAYTNGRELEDGQRQKLAHTMPGMLFGP